MQSHDSLKIVGEVGTPIRLSAAECLALALIGLRQVIYARQQWTKEARLLATPPTEIPPKPTPW